MLPNILIKKNKADKLYMYQHLINDCMDIYISVLIELLHNFVIQMAMIESLIFRFRFLSWFTVGYNYLRDDSNFHASIAWIPFDSYWNMSDIIF